VKPLAVVLVGIGIAGGASAQETPPPSMLLSCSGTDVKMVQTGSSTTVTVKTAPPAATPVATTFSQFRAQMAASTAAASSTETEATTDPVYSSIKVPAHMTIVIEGDVIRIRPSDEEGPGWMQRKSSDGWYPLAEVSITEQQIRGKATWGGGVLSGKAKLQVDRTTGDVHFGGFSGVCEKASDQPRERKF